MVLICFNTQEISSHFYFIPQKISNLDCSVRYQGVLQICFSMCVFTHLPIAFSPLILYTIQSLCDSLTYSTFIFISECFRRFYRISEYLIYKREAQSRRPGTGYMLFEYYLYGRIIKAIIYQVAQIF